MKIGIMGAMSEEIELIKSTMVITDEVEMGTRCFYCGTIDGHEIILSFSRWGKVAASSTVTTLLTHFGVELVIFTGVAGAVDQGLNIGDIVIGNKFYQHDMDATPIFSPFQVPLTDKTYFDSPFGLIDSVMSSANDFIKNINEHLCSESLGKFSIDTPKLYSGTIASGDCFVSDPLARDTLHPEGEDVLAVDMESAAVAQICDDYSIPFVAIRTISDKADHSAAVDFQEFVNEVGAHISSGIAITFLSTLA